jgi:parallel beta-helix repeat protein
VVPSPRHRSAPFQGAIVLISLLLFVAASCRDEGSGSNTELGDDPGAPQSSSLPSAPQSPASAPTTSAVESVAPTTTEPVIDAVTVVPGDDLQALVDRYPAGTRFRLEAGTHRMQSIEAKAGNTFEGESGAVLNGSKLLTDFVPSGRYWVSEGQVQEARNGGECFEDRPGCAFSNDLFFDDVALEQVVRLEDVGRDTWFFDYDADRIYLGRDPGGSKVETSVTEVAFKGRVANVTIRGLVIEKYANRAQVGAVHVIAGVWEGGDVTAPGWLVEDNEFRLNHGGGLSISDGMQVLNNTFHHNGQIGLGGAGEGALVAGNEISYNNTAGFSYLWEAGGAKFVKTRDLVVRNNVVHDNYGKGLWTDIDNIDTLIEDNQVYDNAHQGIYHEISYDAVIRNNYVEGNGFDHPDHVSGAGIFVTASPNVEIYGNTVVNNADGVTGMQTDRGTGAHGPLELRNLYVHDNLIEMTTGHTGIVDFVGDPSVFSDRNNRFEDNTYRLPDDGRYYVWAGRELTATEWVAMGNDENGIWP